MHYILDINARTAIQCAIMDYEKQFEHIFFDIKASFCNFRLNHYILIMIVVYYGGKLSKSYTLQVSLFLI